MEARKEKFIENLKKAGGIISTACENTGVSRSTYYRWTREDAEFREKSEEVQEMQIDYVESKLMNLINSGDTTATIFYLKTKGKKRGWTEKVQLQPVQQEPQVQPAAQLPSPKQDTPDIRQIIEKRIKHKKDYIIRLLKKQGKYTAELSMQVTVVAQLLVRTDTLAEQIFSPGHQAVKVEYSREGNEREIVSQKERLYLDYLGQSQKALRALGMNTDARERKVDNDDKFNEFMDTFKDEGE